MYLFSDYINKFIYSCSKLELKKVIILATILFSILPTFFNLRVYFSSYLWFIYLYLIAAYIKLYNIKMNSKKAIIIFCIIYIFIFLSIVILSLRFNALTMDHLALDFSLFELFGAILLFLAFKGMKNIQNNIINKISSTTFGIYLFQSHFIFAKIMWQYIKDFNFIEKKYYFICVIGITLVIFFIGMIIEFIRKFIFKYTIDKILEKDIVNRVFNKIDSKLLL